MQGSPLAKRHHRLRQSTQLTFRLYTLWLSTIASCQRPFPVRDVQHYLEHFQTHRDSDLQSRSKTHPGDPDLHQVYGETTTLTNAEATDLSILTLESCHERGSGDFAFNKSSVYITGLLVNRLDLSLL